MLEPQQDNLQSFIPCFIWAILLPLIRDKKTCQPLNLGIARALHSSPESAKGAFSSWKGEKGQIPLSTLKKKKKKSLNTCLLQAKTCSQGTSETSLTSAFESKFQSLLFWVPDCFPCHCFKRKVNSPSCMFCRHAADGSDNVSLNRRVSNEAGRFGVWFCCGFGCFVLFFFF